MNPALWPLARVWSLAARTRVALYASGRLEQKRLLLPVVSVGNLSAGGTGKTPFVIWLYQQLRGRGLRPAVLTRGYRRADPERTILLDEPAEWAATVGDEVQVMLLNGVAPIGVDADRFRSGRELEARGGVDLHILDDGFQHLQLARELDIVLVDSTRPPWRDDVLPAGRLREAPSALKRAAIMVLTRVQQWTDLEHVTARLRLINPRARLFLARTRVAAQPVAPAYPPPGSDPICSKLALAFAGIGNPKAFFADLCVAGAKVVATRAFRDHYRYTARDLNALQRQARKAGAEELVTTEKDAVKLSPELRVGLEMPLRVVRIELEVERGEELVDLVVKAAGLDRSR